jgi:tetratricopeptide (TPR) repeat protein
MRAVNSLCTALVYIVASLAVAAPAVADEPAPLELGTKVLPKAKAIVMLGDQPVDVSNIPVPWVVQNVSGEFLLVGGQQKGWVRRSEVVTLDEAPEYYTDFINSINDVKETTLAYGYRAVAWRQKGEWDKEIADYTERLRLAPDSVTYYNRGIAWIVKKDFDNAIADFNQAIRLDPGYVRAYDKRGIAWNGKRLYDRAIHDYDQAMKLDSNYASAFNNAAWLLATCPQQRIRDGKRAVDLALKACDLTAWSNGSDCGTLAAAYAEIGDFDSAVKYQRKAIELNASRADFVSGARARLEFYVSRRPYRDE